MSTPSSSRILAPLFALGQQVYLRVSPEDAGMITGLLYRPGGLIIYFVTWSDHEETQHWGCELTAEKQYDGVPTEPTKVET